VLLKKKLPALVAAGLDGVNLSLDTLDRKKYQAITRFDKLDEVLAGLKLASHYPQLTVKINVVLMEEWNRNEMLSLARLAKNDKVHVRFIEYMPIGSEKDYHAVPEKWARAELEKHFGKLVAETKRLGNGPAHYVKLPDFVGSVGFISAMSNHFCGECNRVRVTSEGFLKTCLFFDEGYSLKAAIQKHQLTATILQAISVKPEKHLFLESHVAHKEAKNMIQIGG
jgi:cyclic pyranopterin phosphate synthase